MSKRLAILALALLGAIPATAGAQQALARGIDPVGADLAVGSDAFLTLEGARTQNRGTFGLSLLADYHHGLMALQVGDEKVDDLLSHRLDLHLTGFYALTNWLELGADLPFTAVQSDGFDALERESGFSPAAPSAAGIGDLRLLVRARILDESRHGVGLAALGELRLPTGDDESFLGERGFSIAPALVAERSFGAFRLAAGGGYRYRSDAGRFLNLYTGDEIGFTVAGAYALPAEIFGEGMSALAEVAVATPSRAPFNAPDADALKTGLEGLLGLRGELGAGFSGLVGVGTGLAAESGLGRQGMRAFAGVRWQRTVHDRDGDGIPDAEDHCPDVREDRDGFEDGDGCPDPDNDRDGVPDVDDMCPDKAGPRENQGCPDSDDDDIPDHEDACPDEYGAAKYDGCPAGDPLASFDDGRIELRGAVNFDTGKATIRQESWGVLDQVARLLREHPEVRRVRVDGHTDSVGSASLNRDLSRRRAAAVVQYLIRKGIERERFSSRGLGEDEPIATNATALGRAKNRRVEFTVLEQAE